MSKVGIENLKKVAALAISFCEQVAKNASEGFNALSAFDYIDELAQVPGIVKSGSAIIAELKDLDEAERTALYEYVKEEFDIPQDKVEYVIEESISVGIGIVKLVQVFKA